MSDYVEAFTLGNAAILSNVCLLPLYPALFVMLANQVGDGRRRRSAHWLGVFVLAGIVTFMMTIGFILYHVRRSVADVLDWLLPGLYATVFVLGVALVLGRNPSTQIATTQSPVLRNPAASAYLYGMFLAPMTLPCTGPLILSAFVIGGVGGAGSLADSLTYFVCFSLGFGWPLVLMPLLATPVQRQATRFLGRHHRVIGTFSGLLLIGIAVFGYWTEVRPSRR